MASQALVGISSALAGVVKTVAGAGGMDVGAAAVREAHSIGNTAKFASIKSIPLSRSSWPLSRSGQGRGARRVDVNNGVLDIRLTVFPLWQSCISLIDI